MARKAPTFGLLLARAQKLPAYDVPLTMETKDRIDVSVYKKIQQDSIMVNNARRAVLDADALSEGQVVYAGLGVM